MAPGIVRKSVWQIIWEPEQVSPDQEDVNQEVEKDRNLNPQIEESSEERKNRLFKSETIT